MKKGFTLIEILIIIVIIGILASVILLSMQQSKKKARINGAKTSLRSILPAILSCKYGEGNVNAPIIDGDICNPPNITIGAKWPALSYGYSYGAGTYNSSSCNFKINTGSDETELGNTYVTCDCLSQVCE